MHCLGDVCLCLTVKDMFNTEYNFIPRNKFFYTKYIDLGKKDLIPN